MSQILPFHLPKLLRPLLPCLVMLIMGWLLVPASARAGGFYNVMECSPGHAATPDASVQGTTTDFSASTSCASGNWLQVQSAAFASAGAAKQWSYTAPAGTRIERLKADYGLVGDPDPDGNRSYLFITRHGQSEQENLSVVGVGSTGGTYDSTLQNLGPLSAVGVGVFCSKPIGSCGYAPGQFSRLSAISFRMEDISPPGIPVVEGAAADGNWVNGTTRVAVGDVDLGGGVYRTTVEVNGTQAVNDVICNPGQDGNGYVGTMTPCDAFELRYIPLNTGATPFVEGSGNAVRVCTHEYGFGAASTCASRSFKVDNVAPGPPQSIDVGGGQGWRRDNEFDLSWANPAQEASPIAAAVVRIDGPGGYVDTTTYPGDDIASVEGISVPGVGAYRADVHLVDSAGNGSPANEASVDLRFDDTVPVKSDPEIANGWVSRAELAAGHLQRWRAPNEAETPPSGIAGYRTAITGSTDTDPCAGAADPRTCAGPLTEIGINSNSRTLSGSDLGEGIHHIHVVPVSGSGMRATTVGHTPIKVDLTDPTTVLRGTPDGWVNRPVELEAVAEDALSGMADTAEYPDDAPPATMLSVDGDVQQDPDSAVSATVIGQGTHQVRYWARDLAGNSNDGAGSNESPGSTVVRIDTTPPQLAFSDGQDPADPDRLVAPVSDGLSGVVAGSISYRRSGAGQWIPIETSLDGDRLTARVDSNDLQRGIRYEFRADAVDAAGNKATTTKRADGSEMSVVGPFRLPASFSELTINGRERVRIGYRKPALIGGRLLDSNRDPIADARIELTESYDAGSVSESGHLKLTTDPTGRFRAQLPAGPSRSVVARYDGDLRRLGADSEAARLRVRGKVTLRATRRVRAGAKATFSGRVRAAGARFSGGKSVEVQVRVGSRWKTVGRSIRTDGKGRYELRYRFVASYTRPVRYRFRAVVLRERGWPYLPAASKQRRVLVRP